MDWERILREIQDFMFPQLELDTYQRSLYYHVLRHSRVVGRDECVMSVSDLASGAGMSTWKARVCIREMKLKGCVVYSTSKEGHTVRVFLPTEIESLSIHKTTAQSIDLEDLDVYTDRKYVEPLLARENNRCFYCLLEIDASDCALDHVVPKARGGADSYMNVVAACHRCNSRKQATPASDFLRSLYRSQILSEDDLRQRQESLESLCTGKLIPKLEIT